MQTSNLDYIQSRRTKKNPKKLRRRSSAQFHIQFNKLFQNIDINFFNPIFFVTTP